MKINFRLQIIVTLILVIAGFISSLWFNKDIYTIILRGLLRVLLFH